MEAVNAFYRFADYPAGFDLTIAAILVAMLTIVNIALVIRESLH